MDAVEEIDRSIGYIRNHILDGFASIEAKFNPMPVAVAVAPRHTPARPPSYPTPVIPRSDELKHARPKKKRWFQREVPFWAKLSLTAAVTFEFGAMAFYMVEPW